MIEAALAFILVGQRVNMSAAGPPPPIFSFEIADMPSRAQRSFGIYRGPHEGPNPERIDRWSQQGNGGGSRDSVHIDHCPALRPLLEQAVRLPLPSPVLARMPREYGASPDRVSYQLRGRFQDDQGNFGYLEMSAVERPGSQPSRLARWALDVEAAFQACLDRRGPPAVDSGEGPR